VNAAALRAGFAAMGVEPGACVVVHSSFKSLGPVEGGPQAVIETLLSMLGPSGTLLMPTYNFTSWTEQRFFDVANTKSEMGVLTELSRLDPRFTRTLHPIYSFAASGRLAAGLGALDPAPSYGTGTVFDAMVREDAVIVSLGLGFNSTFTLTHHVESVSGACRYRYEKHFPGTYVGRDGARREKTYSMMVRDVARGVRTDIIPAMTELVRQGAIKEHAFGPAACHWSRSKDFMAALLPIARERPEMLHRIEKPA
jgi:aminoglycoside 3-N-acetyltransferase